MKVILLQDDKNLGKKGDLIEINDGYARNYVLPRKLAVEATPANLNDLKLQKERIAQKEKKLLEAAQTLASTLSEKEISIYMKAGEGGKAFGSISGKEIAEAYKAQFEIELDKKKIQLSENIRTFGLHEVVIKLHPKVQGTLKINVKSS
ncbi:MAG: 50S ribosomal protein L9 [Lachnospiraceae bacterium]|jgi:large subunit ribosomal protein L9|nr:50S ribosomal protein L9 [Lachnospiraceae bacterium]